MVIPSCCWAGMGQRWNEQQFPAKMAAVQSPCIRRPEAFLETLYVFMLLLAIPLNPFVLLITFQLILLGFLDLSHYCLQPIKRVVMNSPFTMSGAMPRALPVCVCVILSVLYGVCSPLLVHRKLTLFMS